MEIRNEKLFIIFTSILIVLMVSIIFGFSSHPLGADFTTYVELKGDDFKSLDSFSGRRIAVRGVVTITDPRQLFTIEHRDNIIGYIRQRNDPTAGRSGRDVYESFKSSDFTVTAGDAILTVKGQPEIIRDQPNRIVSQKDSSMFWDVIINGKEYSVLGEWHVTAPGKGEIIPYLVSYRPILAIKKKAEKENEKIAMVQYGIIGALILLYATGIWYFNFSKADEEEGAGEKTAIEEEPARSEGESAGGIEITQETAPAGGEEEKEQKE